ncbi:MAG: XRE family transcriptional regulator [Peptoniphilus harei]|nr:XRE family transcriptional regulator [Peptoniphilus harei]
MKVGEMLKELRTNKNLSLDDVSKQLGIARQTLYKYETGIITNIPLTRIEELAKIYRVKPGYIMGWKDDSKLEILGKVDVSSNYPYIPFSVAAGSPISIDGISDMPSITIPNYLLGKYANNNDVIIMRVSGESMNKIIPNNSLIGVITNIDYRNLKNGDLVVFECNYEYSVKRFFDAGDKLIFKPDSTDPSFADIVVNKDENTRIVGKVIMYSILID